MKVKDIANSLQQWAPLSYQESYDNSGLIVGDANAEISSVLISLDVTEEIVQEAIDRNCDMIVAHHPLVFKGLKQITPNHWVNRCIISAIKNDIAIYAIHTNLDNVHTGVNAKLAEKIGLQNTSILSPKGDTLLKLVTFTPTSATQKVLDALHEAGAGHTGEYIGCSFQVTGMGSFKGSDHSNPTVGKKNEKTSVEEQRIEVILPENLKGAILSALKSSHPYEEAAYFLQALENKNDSVGSGMIGQLELPLSQSDFLQHLKLRLNLDVIRYTRATQDKIHKVAICGGSGSFLLKSAMAKNADAFVTGDFKYHDFFEGEGKILIADIGHYESEAGTKELLYDFLRENFTNIAVRLTEVNTNPIHYI